MPEPHLDRCSHQMLIDAATKASTEKLNSLVEAIAEAAADEAQHRMQTNNNDMEAKLHQLELDNNTLQEVKKIQAETIFNLNAALMHKNKELEDMPKNHLVDLHDKEDIIEELQSKLQNKDEEIKNLKERVVNLGMASARAIQPQHSSITSMDESRARMQPSELQLYPDRHIRKKVKVEANLETNIKITFRLSASFAYFRSWIRYRISRNIPHKAAIPLLEFFEQLTSQACSDQICALIVAYNNATPQPFKQSTAIPALASMQFIADHKPPSSLLQILQKCYHHLNYAHQEALEFEHYQENSPLMGLLHKEAWINQEIYLQTKNMSLAYFKLLRRRSETLLALVEYFGLGFVVLSTPIEGQSRINSEWWGHDYLGYENRDELREACVLALLGGDEFIVAFKTYCELLERYIWNPIFEGRPIHVDVSSKRPLPDILEEFDQLQRAQTSRD